jgi:hypothetical protein
MAVLEVRAEELRPVLSGEPGSGDERGDEEDGEDDPYELVHYVKNCTPLVQRALEAKDPPQDRE